MKLLAASAIALALSFAAVTSSQAMPLAPLGHTAADDSTIIRVIDGCGPSMHRGPYGACRPRYSCPWGWHPGPYGWRCFRN